jgi:hypothetical protein
MALEGVSRLLKEVQRLDHLMVTTQLEADIAGLQIQENTSISIVGLNVELLPQ